MSLRVAVVVGMLSFPVFVLGASQLPAQTNAPCEHVGGQTRPVPPALKGPHQGTPTKPNGLCTDANLKEPSGLVPHQK